jgi:hypothetical protein
MNVKGSIFITIVRIIKKDKSGVYSKYLTTKDREILNQQILTSTWYPFETYKHCLTAIFEVVAKKDLEVAKQWGRLECQAAMTTIYAGIITGRDPMSFLKRYEIVHKNFFDFGKIDITVEGKNRILYKSSEFDVGFVPLYYLTQGWIERGLELCGAKNIKCEFTSKGWEGQPFTAMRFTWNV